MNVDFYKIMIEEEKKEIEIKANLDKLQLEVEKNFGTILIFRFLKELD